MFDFFASCPRGLETVLCEELQEIANVHAQPASMQIGATVPGGVHVTGDWTAVLAANLHSRIASRILLQIAQCPYRSEQDIFTLAYEQAWEQWFSYRETMRVDTTAIKVPQTAVRSLEFVTLRIKDAICDRLRDKTGNRPDIDTVAPDVRVYAFLNATHCTLYLDTSGEPLFKRGWRLDKGAAPLRENLAAGILRLVGWQSDIALYDPMCGSGTFLAEAAQRVLNIAPGLHRSFGFEKLKPYDSQSWRSLKDAAHAACQTADPIALPDIYGSDISGDMLIKARCNLERAGVPAEWPVLKRLKQLDARAMVPPCATPGILIANPPYGERIEIRGPRGELRHEIHRTAQPGDNPRERFTRTQPEQSDPAFFNAFGDALKQRFTGWQAFILTSDRKLPGQLRLRETRKTPLYNGALECRLFRFELLAGSLKPARQRSPQTEADD